MPCVLQPVSSDVTSAAVKESPGTKASLKPHSDYISADGLVSYEKIIRGPAVLLHNIAVVQEIQEPNLGEDEAQRLRRLAFYLNAYNIWIMYKVYKRMKDSHLTYRGAESWLARARLFYFSPIKVAGQKTNFLDLENKIIRAFGEPRIHFAINCGSWSCPRLPQYLFEGSKLEEQLDERARVFLNGEGAVFNPVTNTALLSAIFKWFRTDFDTSGGVVKLINNYKIDPIPGDAIVRYQHYDWSVNWTNNARAMGIIGTPKSGGATPTSAMAFEVTSMDPFEPAAKGQ